MTKEQIEAVLKAAQAKNDKEGNHALPDGSNVTLHVAHDGASVSVQKVESVRFDGELVYARSSKALTAIVASDVYAVSVEGAGGTPQRRPAGFG
jgi:anti-sigma-K factor RskA